MKVAITGSSGLIGTALVASLRSDGHQVIRLVRRPPRSDDEVRWDPRAADAGLASAPGGLEGLGACVHLAGAGVASRRWTSRYKAEIRASRVLGTRALAGALARLGSPPATLVAASAIGWYSGTGSRDVDESAPAGKTFLARLVRDWEAAADPASEAGIRVVHPRSGLVLTPAGGLLARLLPLARRGLCPRFASGHQAMSWISLSDEIGAIRFLLDRKDISGPVNLTAPEPVTNSAFTAALNAAVGRRDLPWLRVPAPLLRLGLGEASAELLTSTRVVPKRLVAAGYQFRYAALPEALAAELASRLVPGRTSGPGSAGDDGKAGSGHHLMQGRHVLFEGGAPRGREPGRGPRALAHKDPSGDRGRGPGVTHRACTGQEAPSFGACGPQGPQRER